MCLIYFAVQQFKLIFIFRVLEDLKNTPFSLQISLSRASSIINDSNRSHMETPNRHRTQSDGQNSLPLSLCLNRMKRSTDIMAAEAEKLFYDCEYIKSFKILNE